MSQAIVYVAMAGQAFSLPRAPASVWAIMPSETPIAVPIALRPWETVAPLERGKDWHLAVIPGQAGVRLRYTSRLIPASIWLLLEYHDETPNT